MTCWSREIISERGKKIGVNIEERSGVRIFEWSDKSREDQINQ